MINRRPAFLFSVFSFQIFSFFSIAAPSLRWDAAVEKPASVDFAVYQGETITLTPRLVSYGSAVSLTNATATLYWQTNGMAAAWWTAPATVSTTEPGRISATWAPTNDVGAAQYSFFIRASLSDSSSVYRAFGTLSMRASPGYSPTAAPAPDYQWVTPADMQAAIAALALTLSSATGALAAASEFAITNEAAIRSASDVALLASNEQVRVAYTNLAWIHDFDFATLKSGLNLALANVTNEAAIRAAADTALLSSNTLARAAITNEATIRALFDTALSNQVVNLPRVPTNAVTGWLLYDAGSNKWLRVSVSNYSYYISEVL